MAEQETKRKRSQQMVSEVIVGQRLPFLLTAAAQHPFVQSLPNSHTIANGSGCSRNNGRYWIRTSDPFRVKEVRYHCANRPHNIILNHQMQPSLSPVV